MDIRSYWIDVCDKEYRVGYVLPYGDSHNDFDLKFVKGIMVNYHNGNVILKNEKGVWHIPYSSIKWLLPTGK